MLNARQNDERSAEAWNRKSIDDGRTYVSKEWGPRRKENLMAELGRWTRELPDMSLGAGRIGD